MENKIGNQIKNQTTTQIIPNILSIIVFFALAILGCFLAKTTCINFNINGHELHIHLFICILLTWCAIVSSILAVKKFSSDMIRIAKQEKKVLNCIKHSPEKKSIMFKTISGYIIFPTIIFSSFAIKVIYEFNLETIITFYLNILAVIFIITMLLAFGFALYIVSKITAIFNEDFVNYEKLYPIATPIFEKCYHIFFHGIVLFWIIGILLFILISLLCLNTAATGICLSLNVYTIIVAYISIILGFILSTIYPYYITKRKVEELKLKSIKNLSVNSQSYNDRLKQIKESPNNINSNTSIRVYSTLTIIISIVAQVYSIYTLINGI